MGVFEEMFNPMWVFTDYTKETLPDFIDPGTIDVISAPSEAGIGSSFEWSLEKMGIRGAFSLLGKFLSSIDEKAREMIVVNEYLKYVEAQNENGADDDLGLVSTCCFDLIVLSYLVSMNKVNRKKKSLSSASSAFIKGTINWIKGYFRNDNDNSLLYRVGEAIQSNYTLVNSVLFRRSYAFLTNCFAVGKFISEEEYQLLCNKYIFDHRSDYLKIIAPAGHPVLNEMSLSDIAYRTRNNEFARQVVEYYNNKYSGYHWFTQVSESQMDYFVNNRVFQDDIRQ